MAQKMMCFETKKEAEVIVSRRRRNFRHDPLEPVKSENQLKKDIKIKKKCTKRKNLRCIEKKFCVLKLSGFDV